MALGKIFIILGALLSILGTYVFALYGAVGVVGSGIGFILNLTDLFENAALYAGFAGLEIWIFYILLIVFIIFLAAGILQLVGLKSRAVGIIFSLFPLGVGIMFILLFYTEILGLISALFGLFFIGEQFGDIFPILVDIGAGNGLGAFFILGGGALGLIGCILPKD
ncbi:MAG: hypothetical protein HWN80_14995 [Candidatus Lokiarchaeota archaeon]|nr:hypothetical protein [Candidatus Lokiarchaeota archaeon]